MGPVYFTEDCTLTPMWWSSGVPTSFPIYEPYGQCISRAPSSVKSFCCDASPAPGSASLTCGPPPPAPTILAAISGVVLVGASAVYGLAMGS